MRLTIAEHNDFSQIIRQTYSLWSSGLSEADYGNLVLSTRYQPWAKRNNTRWVYKSKDQIIAGCRLVQLPFLFKGTCQKVLGLGAVFTAENWRGQGLATRLIKTVVDNAKKDDFAGVVLLSAIDSSFYQARGFDCLGNLDFELDPRIYSVKNSFSVDQDNLPNSPSKAISVEIRSTESLSIRDRANKLAGECNKFYFSSFLPWLNNSELDELHRCYLRWLARQPYGIMRNLDYFKFQLAKFLYFSTYSSANKPVLYLTILKQEGVIIGYAFTECSGTSLRILDLIGDDASRAYLWQSLILQAQNMNLAKISGFESMIRDFIPRQKLDHGLINSQPEIKTSHIQCSERLWSQPMFLPLKKETETLSDYNPCPFVEFDYF